MWIWVIVIAVIIGAILGAANSNDGDGAMAGALGGGCMAVSCLGRLALYGLIIIGILWLCSLLFG